MDKRLQNDDLHIREIQVDVNSLVDVLRMPFGESTVPCIRYEGMQNAVPARSGACEFSEDHSNGFSNSKDFSVE